MPPSIVNCSGIAMVSSLAGVAVTSTSAIALLESSREPCRDDDLKGLLRGWDCSDEPTFPPLTIWSKAVLSRLPVPSCSIASSLHNRTVASHTTREGSSRDPSLERYRTTICRTRSGSISDNFLVDISLDATFDPGSGGGPVEKRCAACFEIDFSIACWHKVGTWKPTPFHPCNN